MNIKNKLKDSQEVFGIWSAIPSPEVVNVFAKTSLDYVIIDFEHSPVDYITAQRMVMAAKAEGKDALVRVGRLEEVEILRALDIGCDGIIVPHIESREDLCKVYSYAMYDESWGGGRGYSPYTRAGGYTFRENYTRDENRRLLYGIIIESEAGMRNLPEIVNDPNLDLAYLGAYDISLALGYPGQVNNKNVISKITECIKIIVGAGKAAGCMIHGKDDYDLFASLGVKFFVYKVDTAIICDGIKLLDTFTRKK